MSSFVTFEVFVPSWLYPLYSQGCVEARVEPPRRGHRGQPDEALEVAQELTPRDLARPERRQVRRRHLAVDHLEAPSCELARQHDDRDLRGVRPPAEHRLAEEHAAERDTVEAAGQHRAVPHFHGMRVPASRQRAFVGPGPTFTE